MKNQNTKDKAKYPKKPYKSNKPNVKLNGESNRDYGTATTHNSPEWYNHSPQLTKDAASIPFVNYTGIPTRMSGDITGVHEKGYTLPGIMKLNYIPTYGVGRVSSDALNIASNRNYAEMRRWNSGSRNYEAPDYMMHFMAIDNAFILWGVAVRAYGLLNHYTYENRYMPKHLIESMGIDFDDLIANQTTFRTYINQYAAKLNSCPMPKQMDIVKRHLFTVSNVYYDHTNQKSQIYYFMPSHIYKYDATTRPTGGSLTLYSMPSFTAKWGVEDFKTAFDDIINALLTDEDFSIMGGDTVKAFNECWTLGSVESQFTVEPIYDEQILMQIHNASLSGSPDLVTEDAWDIYQQDGVIKTTPATYIGWDPAYGSSLGFVLDSPTDNNPTPEQVMYMSRLVACPKKTTTSTELGEIESCGSEVVTTIDIFTINPTDGEIQKLGIDKYFTYGNTVSTANNTIMGAAQISTFDWHPRISIVDLGSNGVPRWMGQIWETKNIAVLSRDNVNNLNETAILSLLALPIRDQKVNV